MRKVTRRHTIPCDVDTFWKVFFDKAFNEELHIKELGFSKFEIISQTETARRLRGVPKLNMPKPVAALIGDGFAYEEEGSFDRAKSVFRWKMIPSTMRDKVKNEGSVTVEPAGEGACVRIDEMMMEAKVFGLGGMIEGSAETEAIASWDKNAVFMTKWLQRPRT